MHLVFSTKYFTCVQEPFINLFCFPTLKPLNTHNLVGKFPLLLLSRHPDNFPRNISNEPVLIFHDDSIDLTFKNSIFWLIWPFQILKQKSYFTEKVNMFFLLKFSLKFLAKWETNSQTKWADTNSWQCINTDTFSHAITSALQIN